LPQFDYGAHFAPERCYSVETISPCFWFLITSVTAAKNQSKLLLPPFKVLGPLSAGSGQREAGGGAGVEELTAVHGGGLQEEGERLGGSVPPGAPGSEYFAAGSILNYALFVAETRPDDLLALTKSLL
jgi:hypothetical protein